MKYKQALVISGLISSLAVVAYAANPLRTHMKAMETSFKCLQKKTQLTYSCQSDPLEVANMAKEESTCESLVSSYFAEVPADMAKDVVARFTELKALIKDLGVAVQTGNEAAREDITNKIISLRESSHDKYQTN